MAIYHLSGVIISRNKGQSSIACAAYRSGEELHDKRYGKIHNYSKRRDVAYKEILLPTNAPTVFINREVLWNAVEAIEKRKDAQLAREFNISLPRELTLTQNVILAKEFVKKHFVEKGMIADLCIHNDKTPDGKPQPHVHVMLTLREVKENGFGQKVRAWNAKENLLAWRKAWEEHTNRYLSLNGYDARIDHRTLKEQGINVAPQRKIGLTITKKFRSSSERSFYQSKVSSLFWRPSVEGKVSGWKENNLNVEDHVLKASAYKKV